MDESDCLPEENCDRPLDQVVQEFGRRLRPSGSDGEIDEWSLYDESFRRFAAWAKDEGCFYPTLKALKEGGREHDLTYDSPSNSWLKFTKPTAAGYVVTFHDGAPALEPALPQEYLKRLILQNEIFSDQVTFVGISGQNYRYSIITRQPDIPGIEASNQDIIQMMPEELGFRKLENRFSVGYADSLAFIKKDIAVFDLRPANVVKTSNGLIVPIDSIPHRLTQSEAFLLQTTQL